MNGLILGIKTDQPETYICLASDDRIVAEETWQADRQLSDTLLAKIEALLQRQNSVWSELAGVVLYKGPGSFTGLRIGATVANTLAHSEDIPVASANGDDWFRSGSKQLQQAPDNRLARLTYGGEANITQSRK